MLKVMAMESDGLDLVHSSSSSVKWGQQSLETKHVSALSAMLISKDSNNDAVKAVSFPL